MKQVIEQATDQAYEEFLATRPNLRRAVEAVPDLASEQRESVRNTAVYLALVAGLDKAEQEANVVDAARAIVSEVLPVLFGNLLG